MIQDELPSVVMERLYAARQVVRAYTGLFPRLGLALSPALPRPAEIISVSSVVPADRLPDVFPLDRPDDLVLGMLANTTVVAWRAPEATGRARGPDVRARGLPVRLAGLLGADVLFVAGGAVALTPAGGTSLALVDDHLNLLGANPLVGPNLEALGPRFPDMTGAYDAALRSMGREVAARRGIAMGGGVLAAIPSPDLATPADCSALRDAGADLVCSATVPEVIVARHMGMRSLALLAVTECRLSDGRVAPRDGAAAGQAVADAVAVLREMAARFG